MCFCFLCLVCPVLQVYLDCLPLVFSNVYLVHLCSLFNGQWTNSSFLLILFVLSYLTCSGFIWLFTLLVILSYLPFLVLSYLPFLILSYIPFFGIELSPIFGIELSSILWYWVISHFLVLIISNILVLSYLPILVWSCLDQQQTKHCVWFCLLTPVKRNIQIQYLLQTKLVQYLTLIISIWYLINI